MSPTKVLVGQVLVVFGLVVAGLSGATQYVAAQLAYQPELGRPATILFGTPIYAPWCFFVWWFVYDAYAPSIFATAGFIAASGGLAGAVAAIIGSVWRARQAKLVTTYGSARWATPRDLKRAGLLDPAGVFLGRQGDHYLRHDGPEHVMAFAPTRSGKGVGLVVPSLLSWTGSAVIRTCLVDRSIETAFITSSRGARARPAQELGIRGALREGRSRDRARPLPPVGPWT